MTRAACGLISLALVATLAHAAGAQAIVDTGRADVRLALVGDFGTGSHHEADVADLVHGLAPDLVATLGDDNYPLGGADTIDGHVGRYYAEFIAPYRGRFGPGAAENRFFPALGNHDWATKGAGPYFAYFSLPGNQRYYTVLAGPVELFILDSDPHEPDGIDRASLQAQWLRAALAASTAPYRLVIFHHPAFSSGQHGPNAALQWPFREWGASAVFNGHDHDYERLASAGMPYVIAGTGGAPLHKFGPPSANSQVRLATRYGALLIEADDTRALASFVTTDGLVADQFEIPRSGALSSGSALVADGASWSYLAGAPAPPPGWNAAAFDASAWPSGPAPLGVAEGGEATVIPAQTTQFFVRRFDVEAPEQLGWLELGLLADDAEIAYLNGVEVERVGFAAGKHISPAAKGSKKADPVAEPAFRHQTLAPAALVAGSNVLAVELHPDKGKSPESSYDADLVGFPAPEPLVVSGASWSPSGDGRSVETRFSVADASGVTQLLLRAPHDHGAIVTLNGVVVARWHLPLGPVAADAPEAATAREATGPDRVETPLSVLPLVSGVNALAIELHPGGAASAVPAGVELVAVRH